MFLFFLETQLFLWKAYMKSLKHIQNTFYLQNAKERWKFVGKKNLKILIRFWLQCDIFHPLKSLRVLSSKGRETSKVVTYKKKYISRNDVCLEYSFLYIRSGIICFSGLSVRWLIYLFVFYLTYFKKEIKTILN